MTFSITQNGKPLDPSLYTWDEKTRTLTTSEENLVLDFSKMSNVTFSAAHNSTFITGHSCLFNTGSNCNFTTESSCTFSTGGKCTFKTESECMFNTYSNCEFKTGAGCNFTTESFCTFDTLDDCVFDTGLYCTFNTGRNCVFSTNESCTFKTDGYCVFRTGSNCTFVTFSACTFDTGRNCTFTTGESCRFITSGDCTFDVLADCSVIRKDVSSVVSVKERRKFATTPNYIEGYVADGYYYKDNKKQYKAIIADGILSEVLSHKGNVYRVRNHNETTRSYLVKDGDLYAHGETVQKAKENLIYKISNRDTSKYKEYTLDTKISFEDAIKMYRVITGACESGTKYFMNNILHERDKKYEYTVREVIKLTAGQYGNGELLEFFKDRD